MEDLFTMRLEEVYYNQIKSGKKIYEIRLNDAKRRSMQVGNRITFINRADESQTFICEIEQLLYFDTFVDLFNSISKEDCGFSHIKTADQIEDLFLKFYIAKDLKNLGLVAIKVKKIKNTK